MKKLIIPISVALAAGMTPSAHALNLGIWGVGHLSIDSVDDGANSSLYLASNSSRLGISGDHDFNAGSKVLFQYETGADLTGEGANDGNGAGVHQQGQLFTRTRDAYVGVSGDSGTFLLGRLGGLNQWLYDFNLFADQVGDLGNIWGANGLPGRIDNALHYASPDLSGLSLAISYVPEEGVDNTDAQILKANYAADELKVGAAFASVGQGAGMDEHSVIALTASYDMGQFVIGGGFQDESDIGGTAGNDRDSFTLGGSAKVGDGVVKLQLTQTDSDGSDQAATQIAFGYDHMINDATTIYFAYATTDNDANVAFTANNYGHGEAVAPAAAGQDPSAVSIGLVYKFDANLVK